MSSLIFFHLFKVEHDELFFNPKSERRSEQNNNLPSVGNNQWGGSQSQVPPKPSELYTIKVHQGVVMERTTIADRTKLTTTVDMLGWALPLYSVNNTGTLSFEELLNALAADDEKLLIKKIHIEATVHIVAIAANVIYMPGFISMGIVAVAAANTINPGGCSVSTGYGSATYPQNILDTAFGNEYLFKELARTSRVDIEHNVAADGSTQQVVCHLQFDFQPPKETKGLFTKDEQLTDTGLRSYPIIWGNLGGNATTATTIEVATRIDVDYEVQDLGSKGARLLTEE